MSKGQVALVITTAVLLVAGLGAVWYFLPPKSQANDQQTAQQAPEQVTTPVFSTVKLDPTHDYGNKYANGLLPVGDGMYVTTGAKKGSVYLCNTNNLVPASQAGAQTRGPWFVNNNTQ